MQKFLVKLGGFCLLFVVAYSIGITLLNDFGPSFIKKNLKYIRGGDGHMFTRLREADTTRNVDVLILGSSHAYRSFDTRLFQSKGIRAFNFGSSSQTPLQSEFLLQQYLERMRPKLIIYEVWPNTFASDGVESLADLLSNYDEPQKLTGMTVEINSVVGYNTYIVSMINQVCSFQSNFQERIRKGKDLYVHGGFVERLSPQRYLDEEPIRPRPKIFNDQQTEAFRRSLSFLKRNGVSVWIVQAPYTSSVFQNFENRAEIDGFFNNFVQEGLAERYENYNGATSSFVDSLDFFDSHHLSQEGAKKFTRQILSEILRDEARSNNLGRNTR